jgi:hypothetical protein
VITEATTVISEWLKHPTYGVNTMLAKVPRNKVGGGLYLKPPKVTVYDDCSDDCVSMELEPEEVPAVVVFCDSDILFEMDMFRPEKGRGEPAKAQKGSGLSMVASYIVRDTPALDARINGGFTLRAIKMSLNRFNNPNTRKSAGLLNAVHVVKISDLRMQRVAGSVGQSTLAGFVLANLWVLDKAP